MQNVLASLIALPSWSRYCTVTEPCSAGVGVSSLSYLNVTVVSGKTVPKTAPEGSYYDDNGNLLNKDGVLIDSKGTPLTPDSLLESLLSDGVLLSEVLLLSLLLGVEPSPTYTKS